jgi:alpha-tubulin suppressor-like RCC1 family protein
MDCLRISSAAAGFGHSMFMTSDGYVFGCGYNNRGIITFLSERNFDLYLLPTIGQVGHNNISHEEEELRTGSDHMETVPVTVTQNACIRDRGRS